MQKALASAGLALAKSTQALLYRRQFNPNTADKGNTWWDTVLRTQTDVIAFWVIQIFSYHFADEKC